MQFNFYVLPIAALIPMVLGFIWYNPKVFGKAWMQASGMTMEKAKSVNMAKVFGLSLLLCLLMTVALMPMTIHQMGFVSTFEGDPALKEPNAPLNAYIKDYLEQYGTRFRTFKHGALHGTLGALFLVLPAIGINALYEMKSFKYVAIHVGYFMLSMALMGGVICRLL